MSIMKTKIEHKFTKVSEVNQRGGSILNKKVNFNDIKLYDLTKEEKDNKTVVNKSKRKKTKELDKHKTDQPAETRLEKLPKDELRKYGIIIEDDGCKRSPVIEEPLSEWDDDFEEGKLVIDEEESPDHKPDREVPSHGVISGMSPSAKENAAEFSSGGHGAVISSSVPSLRWAKYCNMCDIFLPDEDSLEMHYKGHCSFPGCLDFIENEKKRERHYKAHKAHPLKPFRCEYCKKRFQYYRFTKKHKEVCKVLKSPKCPHCSYSCSKIGQFNKHVAKHVNKINCPDCERSYTLVKKYRKHMLTLHRKEVLFQCPKCPQHFQLSESIMKHLQVHKLNIPEKELLRFIQVRKIDKV